MKDFFENTPTSLYSDLVSDWDITIEEHEMPTVNNEASSNILLMYLFNFDFLLFLEIFRKIH